MKYAEFDEKMKKAAGPVVLLTDYRAYFVERWWHLNGSLIWLSHRDTDGSLHDTGLDVEYVKEIKEAGSDVRVLRKPGCRGSNSCAGE